MKRHRPRTVALLAVAALAVGMTLQGFSIGPLQLPDVSVPGIGALGGTPTVEEAKSALRDAQAPVVAGSDLHTAGTLTVGIPSDEMVPLAIFGSDGSVSGIDATVAYALADQLGLSSVSFVTVDDAASGLSSGCDVVMGARADDASDGVAVVGDYAQSALAVFAKGSSAVPVAASALSGASVGVQAGSVSARGLSDLDLDVTLVSHQNLNEAFAALDSGSVDYVVCDAYPGAYLACSYGDISFAGTLDEPSATGVAVTASATGLQSAVSGALESIQSDGVVSAIRGRWVGSLPDLGEGTQVQGISSKATDAEPAEPTPAG